jgi:signal transduction histidine kinase
MHLVRGGKRWLAIGNRKLSCVPAGQELERSAAAQSIWILRDITASKQAEQEREAARNAMALAEVSTILAHEIRNPLASMELFAGLIAEDPATIRQWVSPSARGNSPALRNGEQCAEHSLRRQFASGAS